MILVLWLCNYLVMKIDGWLGNVLKYWVVCFYKFVSNCVFVCLFKWMWFNCFFFLSNKYVIVFMFDLVVFVVFILIFFFVFIIFGMCMMFVMMLGMSVGVRCMFWMMVGEVLGVVMVVIVVVIGVVSIMFNYFDLFVFLKYLGGVYLIYLGVNMWCVKISFKFNDDI